MAVVPLTYAQSVDYSVSCPNGGSRDISGSYSSKTGEFEVNTVVSDCAVGRNTVSNGTVSASGVYIDNYLQADVSSELTRKIGDSTISKKCTRSVSGTYDAKTRMLDGVSTRSCDRAGSIYAPVLDLAAGFDEDESLEKSAEQQASKSIIEGTWNRCSNGGTITFFADGTASYTSDGTTNCAFGYTGYKNYVGGQCIPDSPFQNDDLEVKVIDAHVKDNGSLSGSVTIIKNGSGTLPISCERHI